MRKARAKLGRRGSLTDRPAPGGDSDGSTGLHCSASSPAPSLHAEGHRASPWQGIQPQNPGAKLQKGEKMSPAAGCETGSCHGSWQD